VGQLGCWRKGVSELGWGSECVLEALLSSGSIPHADWCAAFRHAEQGGFVPVNDQGDGYKLLYPFGWQVMIVATVCGNKLHLLHASLPAHIT
jgi:hypothetical protein